MIYKPRFSQGVKSKVIDIKFGRCYIQCIVSLWTTIPNQKFSARERSSYSSPALIIIQNKLLCLYQSYVNYHISIRKTHIVHTLKSKYHRFTTWLWHMYHLPITSNREKCFVFYYLFKVNDFFGLHAHKLVCIYLEWRITTRWLTN